MMYKRYQGEFLSRNGVTWRCEILQDAPAPFNEIGELTFPADHPLVIDWSNKAKHETVCGSTATLRIESPGDRTYISLYTIKAGAVRLNVYRNNELYWTGALDTEFYEEPYSRASMYDVELTFSDFGILSRKPYKLAGRQTLRQVLDAALAAAEVALPVDESCISTTFSNGTAVTLSSLAVMSANFYDEDGEASTYMEALDGILQPLALKLIQKAGKVYVFDLNAMTEQQTAQVEWDGTDARMGTDAVYNNIKVTFSPYSSADVLSGTLDYGDIFGPEWTNLGDSKGTTMYNGRPVPAGMTAPECYSWYPEYNMKGNWDYNLIDFTMFLSKDSSKVKGLAQIGSDNSYFRINPVLGGSEETGVVGGFYTAGHGPLSSGRSVLKGLSPAYRGQSMLLRTKGTYLPALDAASMEDYYIKISQALLCDPRYNPFEEAGDGNEQNAHDKVKEAANFAYIPVAIEMYDDEGDILCHWENKKIVAFGHPGDSIKATRGEWVDGPAAFGDAWLQWYDASDVQGGCAVLGWKTNRQCFGNPQRMYGPGLLPSYINPDTQEIEKWFIYESFKRAPEGQFIAYPPQGGYLTVRIYNGVYVFKFGEFFSEVQSDTNFGQKNLYETLRWLMYKAPEVSVVKRNLNYTKAQLDDVEYSGELNADAKETLSIDTIVGTSEEFSPTARGLLLTADGVQVRELTRAGVTDHPEHLLIGTLYSQHADRHTVLTGEAVLDAGGLTLYTDAAQPEDVKFLMSGQQQNIRENTADVTLTETRPDEYQGR